MDNAGNVLAPMEVVAVNVNDIVLLPGTLRKFKRIVKEARLDVKGKIFNLDTGFDCKTNRKAVWNAGLKPNIPENVRNRDTSKTKRGRPRHFWIKSYRSRFTAERSFAWEDKYRAVVIRYDIKHANFLGHKLLAYTLINLRHFCGKSQ